ncbi:4-hydroxybenzoate polyprenyltransferase [Amycolatopsis marina]|uniref:4-hydroxybenzoate polyprenyltransferase n=1 Tax=Amycolatopsis marina TaxID=490629 RepID=A0A1I0XVR0_9PSEU|nr:UbiA family prenyltransferase [Amycolatopsis marina]SFB04536.1 4-hydroxybenzoate polyprenyltransferase [Amycolatopsis marina]
MSDAGPLAAAPPPVVPLSTRHRLEAALWLFRSSSFMLAVLAVPPWLIAATPPGTPHLLALVVAVAAFGGFVQVVNDLLDRTDDAVTAAYLPLPARLVSVRQAGAVAAVAGAVALIGVALASTSPLRFVGGTGALLAVTGMLVAYSRLKKRPVLGPVTHAAMTTVLSAGCWLCAGAGRPHLAAAVLATTFLFGMAGNLNSGLRDVDQGGATERTVAVLCGPGPTLLLVAAVDLLCLVLVVVLAVALNSPLWIVLPLVAGAVGWRVVALTRVLPLATRHGQDRAERLTSLKNASLSRIATQLALYAVLSVPLAVAVAAAIWPLSRLDSVYARRIVRGELARTATASPTAPMIRTGESR